MCLWKVRFSDFHVKRFKPILISIRHNLGGEMCEIRNSARNSQDVSTNNNSAAGVGWDWMGNAELLYNCTIHHTSSPVTTHHHTLQYHNVSSCMEAKERAPQWKGDLTANAHLIQRAAD